MPTSPSAQSNNISIAIVGGGIGGLTCAIALLKHAHVSVQIYEAAHKFSEIGAGVAFGPNAQRALKLIGPQAEEAFLKVATGNGSPEMQNAWVEYVYGEKGAQEGQAVTTVYNETGQQSLHRAKFLDELVKQIPTEIAHFGKRLMQIDEPEDDRAKVKLYFKDGTSAEADAVIGADGIHSAVRRYLLGADHPAVDPRFSGVVAYRGLIPMTKGIEALGPRSAQNSFVYVGKGAFLMSYPIDHGEIMNVVALNYQEWEGPWVQSVAPAKLAADFQNFGTQGQAIVKLLQDNPSTAAWALWDIVPGPTYHRGRVVIMGDAAHATTPFQGQGAGQAIEDAFVLGGLFEDLTDVNQVPLAFKAYEVIRRPRSEKVCQTSRDAGLLAALSLPGIMDDLEKFKDNVQWRMDWLWHRDVAGELEQAKLIFGKLDRKEPGIEHLL